jgi:hypothetical protein
MPLEGPGKLGGTEIEWDTLASGVCWCMLGLEQGPLSLVSATEELLERKSSGSGLENQDYGHRGTAALTM